MAVPYGNPLAAAATAGDAAAAGAPTTETAGFASLEDELSLFTNVEFLNEFDLGDSVDGQGSGSSNGDGYDEGMLWSFGRCDAMDGVG